MGLSVGELIAICLVAILLLGAKRIPEIGNALGEGIRNFRKAYRESQAIDATRRETLEDKKKREQ